MRGFLQRLGTFGDVTASGFLVGITAMVNFVSMLVFARTLGPDIFGLFSTCRRLVAFVAPLVNFGGHLGVSRYLGYYTGDSRRRSAVLASALLLCLIALPLTMAFFLPLEALGKNVGWVRGLSPSLWTATAALTATTAAGLLVFSTLRGLGNPQVANTHQLFVLTSYLGIALSSSQVPVERLLSLLAVSTLILNLAFLGWALWWHRSTLRLPSPRQLGSAVKQLGRYSLPRLADGPLQASLNLICILLAPAIGGLALSGYIHISQTIVRVSEVLIVPLSVIFLPLVARQLREGQMDRLARQAQLIYDSIVLIGCFLVIQSIVWAPVLLNTAFGSRYSEAMPFLLVTLPSILPFLLFASFRSFIDGYSVRPVNSLHLLAASCLVLVLGLSIGKLMDGLGISIGYTAAMVLLGVLSVRYVARHFGVRVWSAHVVTSLLLALVCGGLGLLIRTLGGTLGSVQVLAVFATAEIGLTALLLVLAWRLRHAAVVFAISRLRSARAATPGVEIPPSSATGKPLACVSESGRAGIVSRAVASTSLRET